MSRLIVEGGLGVHGRRPFVRLALDDGEAHMDVEHALALADRLRGAAYGALGDAATVEALGGERLTTEEVAAILARLRAMADEWRSVALSVDQREHDGLTALALAAEARDELTGEHAQRVEHVSARLALAAGVTSEEASAIGRASLLHDIGKLKVPDSVLLKPGPLTRDEMDLVRRHTLWGEAILAHGEAFRVARMVARWHHENFDGTGYPDGLRAEAIPLEARVVRIADAFDAMTNDRPYRAARTVEQALDELRTGAGRLFDPELVTQFLDLIEEAHSDAIRSGMRPAFAFPVGRDPGLAIGGVRGHA